MEHETGDPLTGATCASCRFWVRNLPRPDRPGWHAAGNCHRNPATIAKQGDEWCGSHQPRPGLAPAGDPTAPAAPA